MNQQSQFVTETHVPEVDIDARLEALEAELAPTITASLEPVSADQTFKMNLEEELITKAKKRAERQHLIRTFGLIGGGLLTVVAGIVGVILLKRQNHDENGEQTPGQPPGQTAPATASLG